MGDPRAIYWLLLYRHGRPMGFYHKVMGAPWRTITEPVTIGDP